MYLFQPERVNVPGQVTCIYIPPCIYFNHAPSQNQAVFLLTFTFHYVSISTLGNPTPSAVSIKFTFHYVSISTFTAHFISDIVTCIYIPLCTYFNRRNCCINSASSRIYIPLRIYFNLIVCDFLHLDFLFTFHYVSISTTFTVFHFNLLHNLHSTMYLFQPYQEGSREKTKQIYIPLCIYFNDSYQVCHSIY